MTIREAIRMMSMTDEEIYSVIGVVSNIDIDKRTCTVSPVNGNADILEVRLQSVESGSNGIVVVPENGTEVVATFINKEQAFISLCSGVSQVVADIDDAAIVAKDGLTIASETNDLSQTLNSFIDLMDKTLDNLINFKMITSTGPTVAVSPDVILQLQLRKTELTTFKTSLNTIIV